MTLLLSPNLTNALADNMIDAAKAAGLPVPSSISRLHSYGSPHRDNLWHQAQGACPREGIIAPQIRQRALSDLEHLKDWAVSVRDSEAVQTMLHQQKRQQQHRLANPAMPANKAMDQAVAVDDALQLHVLKQIFEEPKVARQNIRADLARTKDPASVASQLERTPDVYGEILGTRRFGVNSGNRHTALAAIRDQVVTPIRLALGEPDGTKPTRPMAVRQPLADGAVNHHLLAFDDAVTSFAATFETLEKSQIRQDISHQKPGAYWHGPGASAPPSPSAGPQT